MAEPKVLVFVCSWCSYGAADAAGGHRLAVPAGVRVVRLPCSGRVDGSMVTQAFASGAAGVLILGCHPGDCHYGENNLVARNRVTLLRRWLAQRGLAPERLRIDWASSLEGERFAVIVSEFYQDVVKAEEAVAAPAALEGGA